MKPLISIVVPVYKVENYLDRCVQSIVNQTYTNLEIILVDDGSPDNCGTICDIWAKKDSRIKVIHKNNGGLSDARNAGMTVATGTYVGFVDSDDYISSNMYQLLIERMLADNSDIAACGVEMVFEDGTTSRRLTCKGKCILNRIEAMQAVLLESWLIQPVWYKLYRTSLVRDLVFPIGKCHEDVYWTYQAVARAEKVSIFDTTCYFYVQRNGSIMGEQYSVKRLDEVEATVQRCEFIVQNMPQLAGLAQRNLIGTCMFHYQKILKVDALDSKNHYQDWLINLARSTGKEWHSCGMLSMKQKMWLNLFLLMPRVTCLVRNILKIGL